MSKRTGATPPDPGGIGRAQPAPAPVAPSPAHPAVPPRYKRILVPVDFSECSLNALQYAVAFAQQYQATLLPFHVIEPAFADCIRGPAPGREELHQRLVSNARLHLDQLSRRFLKDRVHSESLVRLGRAPSEIADTAKAMGADLIIMGTHGTRGHRPSVMGSTAEQVVRKASCPVLTVRFPGAPGMREPSTHAS